MKKHLLYSLLLFPLCTFGQFINEFHYDNSGNDVGEFVEVFLPDGDVNNYCIVLYNNGFTYGNEEPLPTCPAGTGQTCGGTGTGCFVLVNYPVNGLQNGPSDGFALVRDCGMATETVVQLISYEGTFTASNGPATGQTSVDVGIRESSSTPIGNSLQLNDVGVWEDNIASDGACNTSQLPVELISFTATQTGDKAIQLDWATASEENNDYFIVEYSADGLHFDELEAIQGAGTSYEVQTYRFLHHAPHQGDNYYRIRQVDYDGLSSFSPIRAVRLEATKGYTIYPTLANNHLDITYSGRSEESVELVIYNLNGSPVLSQNLQQGGISRLDISRLAKGHYIARFEGKTTFETVRFVKTN